MEAKLDEAIQENIQLVDKLGAQSSKLVEEDKIASFYVSGPVGISTVLVLQMLS
jgi:hypothetical protein